MSSFSKVDPAMSEDPLSNFEAPEYSSELERAFAEETVEAIETKPYLHVSPATPVCEAIEMLHDSGVSSLLVVDGDALVGIFTERDVLERVVEQYPRISRECVKDFMTTDPTIVYQSDPAAAGAAAIAVAGHRHVPVLDMNEKVVGVVSPRRVFEFMEKHF